MNTGALGSRIAHIKIVWVRVEYFSGKNQFLTHNYLSTIRIDN